MTDELSEGDIRMRLPAGVTGRQFDDASHGLSHCMRAVDFIIELGDRYLFVEFKDPQCPKSPPRSRAEWTKKFLAGQIDQDLGQKYRDTFLYEWACGQAEKPIYYLVVVALDTLTEADLLARADALKKAIPAEGPPSGRWKKQIVGGCAVFNIASWNRIWKDYPLSRISL